MLTRANRAALLCATLAFGPTVGICPVSAQAGSAQPTPAPTGYPPIASPQTAPSAPVDQQTSPAQSQRNQDLQNQQNLPQRPPVPATASQGTLNQPFANQTLSTQTAQTLSSLQQGASPQQGVAVPTVRSSVRQVDLVLDASAVYDTNATRSNALRPPGPGLKKHDFIFPVGANVNIQLPYGPNNFSLSGYAGYEFNLHNTQLNSENIGLVGGYQRTFRACAVALDGGFSRSRTQFGQTNFIPQTKNLQTTTSIGGTVNCNLNAGLQPFASLSYIIAKNSDLTRRISDHNTLTYGGGAVYAIPAIGDLGIVASVDDTRFPDRPLNGPFGSTRVKAKSIGVYLKRTTARILQAQVQVNYTSVSDDKIASSFSGLSGNASVRFMPGGRFAFTATAGRAVNPSLSYNADYTLETTWALAASAFVSSRLTAQVGYTNAHRKFYGAQLVSSRMLRNETTRSASASASFSLNQRVALVFATIYDQRRADDPFFNYSGTRATISVNLRI